MIEVLVAADRRQRDPFETCSRGALGLAPGAVFGYRRPTRGHKWPALFAFATALDDIPARPRRAKMGPSRGAGPL